MEKDLKLIEARLRVQASAADNGIVVNEKGQLTTLSSEIDRLLKEQAQLTRTKTINECINIVRKVGDENVTLFNNAHKGFMRGITDSIRNMNKLLNQKK